MDNCRIKTDVYLWSGNGDQGGNGSGEVTFHNLRLQGYVPDPSKYHGCVLSLMSFRSMAVTQAAYNSIVVANGGAGSSIHFQIVDINQSNSITNFNANSQGVSDYSSNAKIVQTLKWTIDNPSQTGATDNPYALDYQGTDPVQEGIYTTSPLEDITVRLIDNSGSVLDMSSINSSGDCSWFAHLVMTPLLRNT